MTEAHGQTYLERRTAAQQEYYDASLAYEDAVYAWYAADPGILVGLCDKVVTGLSAQRFPDEFARVRVAAQVLNELVTEFEAVAEQAHRANREAADAMAGKGQPQMRVLWEYDRPGE